MCLISSDNSHDEVIAIAIVIITLAGISSVIMIGIVLLIYLHIKLMKYDFTTFEYIQYKNDRKERLYKLKKKKITKERFMELEEKALSKTTKKRSKIIKEVTEEKEKEIIEKMMRKHKIPHTQDQVDDEESKYNNSATIMKQTSDNFNSNKNNKKQSIATQYQEKNQIDTNLNKRSQNTENNSISHEDIFDSMNKEKEYVYDSSYKRSNNFCCSSTFCIPCTKKLPPIDSNNIKTIRSKRENVDEEEELEDQEESNRDHKNMPKNLINNKSNLNERPPKTSSNKHAKNNFSKWEKV